MVRKIIAACAVALSLGYSAFADEIKTIDLKPFVGYSPFDLIKADWLLPRGQHVFDGVPWKIDGMILLYCTNLVQRTNPARTNVNDIPVGQKFEKIHLLAASQTYVRDGVPIAKLHLNYVDGTRASLDIRYGYEVRYYQGSWHTADRLPRNEDVHLAWHAQFEPLAAKDSFLRLYHVPLANPSPEKEVRSISLESTKTASALMVAAISVGPANAPALPNDSLGKAPFPDLKPRTGELASGEGFVFSDEGKPIAGALIRVVASREYGADEAHDIPVNLHTATDAAGHFVLKDLPDNCAYHVLIAAPGYQALVYRGLDAKSDPVQVRLERTTNAAPKFSVRARVIGPDGKPVAYAQIERDGVGLPGGGTTWGGRPDVTEHAVSDVNGEFVISSDQNEFERVQVRVSAPGLAPHMEWIQATNRTTDIELGVGAVIRGRVLDLNGKPLDRMTLGIAGADGSSEVFAGHCSTTTRSDGTFVFEHVAPRISWKFFGEMSSFKNYGALPARRITSAANGETNDLGDLKIVKGLHLAGQVKTRDGTPLPNPLKLRLGVESAWDSQNVTADRQGHFVFEGIYPAQVNLSLNIDGWKLSGRNRSLSSLNPWEMFGLLETNKDDLLLIIEKGQLEYNYDNSNGSLPPGDDLGSQPIVGAENVERSAIVLAGSVVDDKTGKPIAHCRVVPGYKSSAAALGYAPRSATKNPLQKLLQPLAKKRVNYWELPFWMAARSEETSNGTFSMSFIPLKSTPILRIEAAGYEPFVTEPMASSTNGLVIRLNRGEGPSGVVLLPDGKPADKAVVYYATSREQFGLIGRGLTVYGGQNKERQIETGPDGKFAFPAIANGVRLYVFHPIGYGEELVQGKDVKWEVRLKTWAALSGTLVRSNGSPASGVKLGLTLYNGNAWDGTEPLLHYNVQTITDARGFFLFTNVPPRRVQVERIIPSGRGGWSSVMQSWLDVEPGITNDLSKVTYDTPPPAPVMEQIRQKLGLQ